MLEKKMSVDEYLETFTPASRPHRTTIVRRIKAGLYRGCREGARWYILVNQSTGDAKADEIIMRWNSGTAKA